MLNVLSAPGPFCCMCVTLNTLLGLLGTKKRVGMCLFLGSQPTGDRRNKQTKHDAVMNSHGASMN